MFAKVGIYKEFLYWKNRDPMNDVRTFCYFGGVSRANHSVSKKYIKPKYNF